MTDLRSRIARARRSARLEAERTLPTAARRDAGSTTGRRPALRRRMRPLLLLSGGLLAAISISACGTESIQVPKSSPYYPGAVVFRDHCSGCHSLAVVGAEGSASNVQNRVKTNGPNFNVRKETVQQILYAVHNGGFSGEIMPENIVVGKQAEEVARFLSHYAGKRKPALPGEEVETEAEEAEKAAEKAEESKYLAKAAEIASGKSASSEGK